MPQAITLGYRALIEEARARVKSLTACASGWCSLLAADMLQRMGLKHVFNLEGGLTAWKEAGGDT
jgi:rhodanese-related sulfurtransferase